ncbi:hypothetical protein AB6E89_17410 [Vibrio breoganii]
MTRSTLPFELSRLLKESTITLATCSPSSTITHGEHVALFAECEPVILIGPKDCEASISMASKLASNPVFIKGFNTSTSSDPSIGVLDGKTFDWPNEKMECLASSKKGETEFGEITQSLKQVTCIFTRTNKPLATLMCCSKSIVPILDPEFNGDLSTSINAWWNNQTQPH